MPIPIEEEIIKEEERKQREELRREEELQQHLEEKEPEYGRVSPVDFGCGSGDMRMSVRRPFLPSKNSQVQIHPPFLPNDNTLVPVPPPVQPVHPPYIPDATPIPDNIPDNIPDDTPNEETYIVTTDLVNAVSTIIENLGYETNRPLSNWWLKAAQTLFLTHYMQSNSFSSAEKDQLLDFLAFLQTDLGDDDCLVLAGSLAHLAEIQPINMATKFTFDASLPLTAIMATIFLLQTKSYDGWPSGGASLWVQRCLYTYVMANTDDEVMPKIYLKMAGEDWVKEQYMTFFKSCNKLLPDDDHKKTLHLIQTYRVKSRFAMQALKNSPQTLLSVVEWN